MGWEWGSQVEDRNTPWEAQGEVWGMLLADALVTADSSVTAGSITADLRTAISFGTITTFSSFLILHRSGSLGGGDIGGMTTLTATTTIQTTTPTMTMGRLAITNTGGALPFPFNQSLLGAAITMGKLTV